jgi:hypothetical protein
VARAKPTEETAEKVLVWSSREVHFEAQMSFQPGHDLGMLVGTAVAAHAAHAPAICSHGNSQACGIFWERC